MSFPSESFDAVYAIEATVHAPSLKGAYSEIYRVLKSRDLFGLQYHEDLANRVDLYPWHYPLAGELKNVSSVWDFSNMLRMTKIGRGISHQAFMLERRLESSLLEHRGLRVVWRRLATLW
jgi:sterol 24-C-methyltransferase